MGFEGVSSLIDVTENRRDHPESLVMSSQITRDLMILNYRIVTVNNASLSHAYARRQSTVFD